MFVSMCRPRYKTFEYAKYQLFLVISLRIHFKLLLAEDDRLGDWLVHNIVKKQKQKNNSATSYVAKASNQTQIFKKRVKIVTLSVPSSFRKRV